MIFGCDVCPGSSSTKEQRAAAHANIEKLLALVKDFESEIQTLDTQVRQTRPDGLIPNEAARIKLRQLQSKKEHLINKMMASLRERLGPEGAQSVHAFITQQFKRRVKMGPENPEKAIVAPGAT
jgi:hypothetical protein